MNLNIIVIKTLSHFRAVIAMGEGKNPNLSSLFS